MDKPTDIADDNFTTLITEDVVQTVIAELTVDAPSSEVKDCLKAYEYGKSFKQLITVFMQFKKEHIVNTLTYLNVPGREEYVKSANVESLVCRIQNLLPDECGVCSEVYCVKNTDPSLLSCEICGQDAHNNCLIKAVNNSLPEGSEMNSILSKEEVLKFLNPLNIPGWHYICKPCSVECIPQDEKGLKKKSKKESKKEEIKVKVLPPASTVVSIPAYAGENNTPKSPTDNLGDINKGNRVVDDVQKSENKSSKHETICRFFLRKRCKYGIKGEKCKFTHPPLCNKLLKDGYSEKGCTKGTKCKFFHPKMCCQSLNKRECSYKNCKFYHVAGTKPSELHSPDPSVANASMAHLPDTSVVKVSSSLESSRSKDDFLGQQYHAFQYHTLQNFKMEILEAMDMRLATALSQMQRQSVQNLQTINPGRKVTSQWGTSQNWNPDYQNTPNHVQDSQYWKFGYQGQVIPNVHSCSQESPQGQ